MQLKKVDTPDTRKLFHQVPRLIYKDDKNWAAPFDVMVENTFNPAKNPSFKGGEAQRWVLLDGNGNLLGRIAAFVNYEKAKTYEQPTGGCGFFECLDNQEAANILFDAAREWLNVRGMEAMDGPVNFGENYINWGLLVDGFMPQGYGMPYNPPYYLKLFENYGFRLFFKQFSYHLDYTMPFRNGSGRLPVGWHRNRIILSDILNLGKQRDSLKIFVIFMMKHGVFTGILSLWIHRI